METLDPVISTYNRVDLVKLARENPAQYAELDAAYKARMSALNAVRLEQQTVQAQAMRQHFAREEAALIEKLPEWSAPEVGSKALDDLRQGVVSRYGFKPEEVRLIADHRYVLMARDAAAYHTLKAEHDALKAQVDGEKAKAAAAIAAKKVAPATRVQRPNPAREGTEQVRSERDKALINRASKARSLSDKAAILAQLAD